MKRKALSPHFLTVRSTIPMQEIEIRYFPPPKSPPCTSRTCPWWPYSSSKDFRSNAAIIVAVLFCVFALLAAFNAGVRYLIRVNLRRRKTEIGGRQSEVEASTVYTDEMRMREGGAAECIICLSEFAVGERIRILEKCSHGFHLQCVQQWLLLHRSCPTCRARCH
ncbi:hypothetical protein M569_07456 [Genlisea aurea]|uniref:RING-type E3 ubiquitin transferase n=1 Tax=Genlisea aurea TaxID=192259 RepID=S8CKT3_9LAMI|nr:hypothetical protein M569_07456 [Genlisea aurea]